MQIRRFINSSFDLYHLIRNHPKWWLLYDISVAVLAIFLVDLFYTKQMMYGFSLGEYYFFPACFSVIGMIGGIYEQNMFNSFVKLFLTLLIVCVFAIIGLILFRNIFLYEKVSRWSIIFIFLIVMFGVGLARLILGTYIRRLILRVLFVGDENHFLNFKGYFNSTNNYVLVGYCGKSSGAYNWLGGFSDIIRVYKEHSIDVVVFDAKITQTNVVNDCLPVAQFGGVVISKDDFIEQNFEQISLDAIDLDWFFKANLKVNSSSQLIVKRGTDIFLATIGLLVTAILYPFIFMVIKLDSKGPVLYSQIRSGRHGQEFKMYKFRTMRVNAEIDGAVWARLDDNRVTKIGNILRKTRLDELPQFWNILKGEMSFVGPRPERPELIEKIEKHMPYFYFRQLVKPGMTGFAQIRYQYGDSIDAAKEKLKYDLYYIKYFSFFTDMQLILMTIIRLMKGSR